MIATRIVQAFLLIGTLSVVGYTIRVILMDRRNGE